MVALCATSQAEKAPPYPRANLPQQTRSQAKGGAKPSTRTRTTLSVGVMGRRRFRFVALPRLGISGSETSAWKSTTFDNSELSLHRVSSLCYTNLDAAQPLAGFDSATSKFILLSRT